MYTAHLPDTPTAAIRNAFDSRRPFQCCRRTIGLDLVAELFPPNFRHEYDMLLEELATPHPRYCSSRTCGTFLRPSWARGPDSLECGRCRRLTCRHCGDRAHPGTECVADEETQRVRALATTQGWKACPSCNHMVERSTGCMHMTCRCGREFCYQCGRRYSVCQSSPYECREPRRR